MGKQDKQDIKILKSKIRILRDENQKLTDEIDRLKSLVDRQAEKNLSQKNLILGLEDENKKLKSQDEPKEKGSRNIAGWTITKDADGYYRAKKWINGKSHSAYIGKRITKAAKPKIQKREREIRSNEK